MNARHTGVDHVANARHGKRSFGDVGGEHDAAAIGWLEYAILLGIRQTRIQRQNFRECRVMFTQRLIAVADLALTRKKYQHVAFAGVDKYFVNRFQYRVLDGQCVVTFVEEVLRPVAHLDGIGAAGDFDDRGSHNFLVMRRRRITSQYLPSPPCGRG